MTHSTTGFSTNATMTHSGDPYASAGDCKYDFRFLTPVAVYSEAKISLEYSEGQFASVVGYEIAYRTYSLGGSKFQGRANRTVSAPGGRVFRGQRPV